MELTKKGLESEISGQESTQVEETVDSEFSSRDELEAPTTSDVLYGVLDVVDASVDHEYSGVTQNDPEHAHDTKSVEGVERAWNWHCESAPVVRKRERTVFCFDSC